MDSVHDLGGLDGLGSPDPDDDAIYHETWEAKADGLGSAVSTQGYWHTSELRHARARLEPAYYLSSSYMGRKLGGYEMLCVEKGLVTTDELIERVEAIGTAERYEEGLPQREDPELARQLRDSNVNKGGGELPPQHEPAFAVGDAVRVRNRHPRGHTRCPRYARRAVGTVVTHHGTSALPDARAHGERRLEPLYSVEFDAGELWGPDRTGDHAVTLNCWEPYLEAP